MPIQTPISGDLSLYFHLPFCQKKCDYCHFFVLPNQDRYKTQLLKSLLKEIEMRRPLLEKANVISVYFGGGTPALVPPSFIESILNALKLNTSLNIEITLEFNPENNSQSLLKNFYEAGVNRLSLGVQTLDAALLKKLGRTHSPEDSKKALENAFNAGFENISIDLMYDLPTQTLEMWKKTLTQSMSFPITHLSLYNLSIEKETVFYKYKDQITQAMPSSEISLKMFEEACATFKANGFNHYEISAFCKPGFHSRHNSGYWLQRPHLGFGPSAFSLIEGKRFQNVKNLKKYASCLDQGQFAIDFEEQLEPESFLRESLALHLRLREGFSLSQFESRFGSLSSDLLDQLDDFEKKKWISKEEDLIQLTSEGVLYHDTLATELI